MFCHTDRLRESPIASTIIDMVSFSAILLPFSHIFHLLVLLFTITACLDQLNSTEIASLTDCTALSDLVEAAKMEDTTSSGNVAKVAAALGASLVAGVGALLN